MFTDIHSKNVIVCMGAPRTLEGGGHDKKDPLLGQKRHPTKEKGPIKRKSSRKAPTCGKKAPHK